MITFFTIVLFTSIWILGVTIASQENMLLHSVRVWAEAQESKWAKVFIICIWCMSSLHSIIGYAFAFGIGVMPFEFHWSYVWMYPLVVMLSSLISGLTWTAYSLLEMKQKYYTNIEELSHFDLKDRKKEYNERKHVTTKKATR